MKLINIINIKIVVFLSIVFPLFGVDAEYDLIRHEFTLNKDGSSDYTYSHKVRLFSSFAVNRGFGESFISYNPEWQDLKINHSYTTMRDGSQFESPENAFNEVLPGSAAGSFPFLHLREMVVSHIALEKDALILYGVTPNKDVYEFLLQAPLRSIFHKSYSIITDR